MYTWDYDLPKNWKPETPAELEWFLVRKINYNDLTDLKPAMIKKHFANIQKYLDPGKRTLMAYYLKHEKKRLSPLLAYQGILIDSLADISANKIIALFDRKEPKDLFDVYTLLVQNKYTVPQLLDLAEKKFGVKFSEFSFWSECTKSFPLLDSLKPYFLPREKNKKELLGNIKEYFLSQGRNYLVEEIGK